MRDLALLILDTGLRIGEALELEWSDVHLKPANGAKFGYLHARGGKSKNARRNLSLEARVRAMLESRARQTDSPYMFPSDDTRIPYLVTSVDHLHSEVRDLLRLPKDFVIHSLRHTFGTRLGEAGADAFSIMRAMGHSSVMVSQKYVHPTPEGMERAFERLEALNQKAVASLAEGKKRRLLAAVSATVLDVALVSP